MKSLVTTAAFFFLFSFFTSAHAVFLFEATLSGAQEVPPVTTAASGSATLSLNDAQTRLEINLSITGLDLDGLQTTDLSDDVLGVHIHFGLAGTNGPIVFGFVGPIGPNDDLNSDTVIDATAGTIFTAWDSNEGSSLFGTLTNILPALFVGNLYFNVHTAAIPSGEIRGQIDAVPEPTALALMGLGLAGLGYRHKKAKTA